MEKVKMREDKLKIQKLKEAIKKIKGRKTEICKITTDIGQKVLIGKDYNDVKDIISTLTEILPVVHPYITKLLAPYEPIKNQHITSIGNRHINFQIFVDENKIIRRVITRDYHCENMIVKLQAKLAEVEKKVRDLENAED